MEQSKGTIIVVEDEELLLKAITRKLESSNYKVISCTGGKQAFEYLQGNNPLPNAIWLDYYLRDMNGLAFMQQLKKNEKIREIPVIVVSNSASPEKVKAVMELGVKKYVLKAEHRLDEIIGMIQSSLSAGNAGNQSINNKDKV